MPSWGASAASRTPLPGGGVTIGDTVTSAPSAMLTRVSTNAVSVIETNCSITIPDDPAKVSVRTHRARSSSTLAAAPIGSPPTRIDGRVASATARRRSLSRA